MTEVTYTVIEEKYAHRGGFRTAYGIAAYRSAEGVGEKSLIDTVHDITPSKEKREGLVADCNRLGLSHLHLYDAVEDFLSE